MLKYLLVLIPKCMNLKILKNLKTKKIMYILYTNKLKIYIKLNVNRVSYDKKTHSFYSIFNNISDRVYIKRRLKKLKEFLFFLICWKKFKIAYTGKGYRIRKYCNLNFLDFTFGSCHFVKAYIPQYRLKLKKKKAIIVYYKYPFILKKNFEKIININLIDLYTQRGLRNSQKLVYRKPKNKAVYI